MIPSPPPGKLKLLNDAILETIQSLLTEVKEGAKEIPIEKRAETLASIAQAFASMDEAAMLRWESKTKMQQNR